MVWREGLPEPCVLDDPLGSFDLCLTLTPVFLAPGASDFVLVVGGQELGRERFTVALAQKKA